MLSLVALPDPIAISGVTFKGAAPPSFPCADSTCAGGAALIKSSNVTFVNCTFIDNIAPSATRRNIFNGSAIAAFSSSLTVHSCLFENNFASLGSSIYGAPNTSFVITNSIFKNNRAAQALWGAAVSVTGPAMLEIKSCLFVNNSASNGGAVNVDLDAQSVISNCTFEHNNVDLNGTAVLAKCNRRLGGAVSTSGNAVAAIVGCTFSNNGALISGGAILHAADTALNITDCYFERNSAGNFGGAVFFSNGTNSLLFNSTFVGNAASSGAAIYANGESVNFTVSSSRILSHQVAGDGAVYITADVTALFNNVTFFGNLANRGGHPFDVSIFRPRRCSCRRLERHKRRDASGLRRRF
jgi:predicted outer membrane repeat protein